MKKTVILFGSPRKNGHTQKLLDVFLQPCSYDIHIYNMYEENIAPCIGCGRCETTHQCFLHDTDPIFADIFTSDFVLFASPVYNYSFPAPMKAFLDRLQPYFSEQKTASVRKGFLLATCGKSGKFSIDVLEKQSKMAFSELAAEFCGSYFWTDTDKCSTLQPAKECKVKALAELFFD